MSSVRLKALRKEFGKVVAVADVNVDVPHGSLMTFLGPSGCGKTTTLRVVAGLERPSGGEVWIGDDCVASSTIHVAPEQRNIGMVFQSYAVWPHMTVFENVAFPLRVRHASSRETKDRVMEALEAVELSVLADRYPPTLSGGQQQRVALARAIVFKPRILLCDEPLSNLDANLREQMRLVIRELQQRLGITCIYVTHDQREALAVSDHVSVMHDGFLIQSGRPEEIYRSPATSFVARFLGHNVIEGELVTRDSVRALGTTLACRPLQDPKAGVAVEIAFRPEAGVVVHGGEHATNVLTGTLRTVSYTGEYFAAEVEVQNVLLRVRSATSTGLTRGAQLAFHVPEDEVHVLPA